MLIQFATSFHFEQVLFQSMKTWLRYQHDSQTDRQTDRHSFSALRNIYIHIYIYISLTKIIVNCTHAHACSLHANICMRAHSSIWPKCTRAMNTSCMQTHACVQMHTFCIHLTCNINNYAAVMLHSSYSHIALILLIYCTHFTCILFSFCSHVALILLTCCM